MNRKWFAELHFWCLIIVLIIYLSFFDGEPYSKVDVVNMWTKIEYYIRKLLGENKTCSQNYDQGFQNVPI